MKSEKLQKKIKTADEKQKKRTEQIKLMTHTKAILLLRTKAAEKVEVQCTDRCVCADVTPAAHAKGLIRSAHAVRPAAYAVFWPRSLGRQGVADLVGGRGMSLRGDRSLTCEYPQPNVSRESSFRGRRSDSCEWFRY